MKAMILAAGRGLRMGDLTKELPKPLLILRGKPLIEWHLKKLANAGFKEVVINISYLPKKIKEFVGDGSEWGLHVTFSEESPVLETGGGIKKALPLLGSDAFFVINADIYSNFDYKKLRNFFLKKGIDAHLILVKNPEHNLKGDFGLTDSSNLVLNKMPLYTFSGIAVYHPRFFSNLETGKKIQLLPLLKNAISKKSIKGELFQGEWSDVGTPLRLNNLNKDD